MSIRNPAWVRDELILALDLYFRHSPQKISENHKEVVALSTLLKQLPIHSEDIVDREKFRNPSGVYMKLCNFLRFDPTYEGKGLDAGSKLDGIIWNDFSNDILRLREVAATIRNGVLTVYEPQENKGKGAVPRAKAMTEAVEGEEWYPEGKLVYRLHRSRERNSTLVKKKKEYALKNLGQLQCEVCDFIYTDIYGKLGEGFIECHHRNPVSKMNPNQKTTLTDLALVCANCHRILHRGGELLSVEALREVVLSQRVS